MDNRPVLDLTNYSFTRNLGDITLFGTWIGPSPDDSEPALVLVPTHRINHCRPVAICLSAAYQYDDPNYLLARAMEYNRTLGFEDSMAHVHKVATIIHDHLGDLVYMPPRPVRREYVAADAIMTHESGRKLSAEILERE